MLVSLNWVLGYNSKTKTWAGIIPSHGFGYGACRILDDGLLDGMSTSGPENLFCLCFLHPTSTQVLPHAQAGDAILRERRRDDSHAARGALLHDLLPQLAGA